jgi:hypothetical protein
MPWQMIPFRMEGSANARRMNSVAGGSFAMSSV